MKKGWILLVGMFLLACSCPSLPRLLPGGTRNQATPAKPATGTKRHESATTLASFSRVRLHKEQGSLPDQLALEADKARSLGQHMFVEFDATW